MSQGYDDSRFDGVRELIRRELVDKALPSLAVAVAQGDRILWEEGFGWADRERRVAATPHTLYSLASISKPITATGLMLLRHQGKVDLDRPANDYLGETKLTARVGDAAEATVRRVANHTSGLPLHCHFFYEDEPYRRPPMDETIRRYGHLVTAPGERYQYSNLGYGILDTLIRRLSGRSYAEFLREEVFLPLGMTHASVDVAPGLEPYAAARYGSDGVPYPFYEFDHPGGSAVFCSAHDLVRFGMFHLKQRLPDQKAILPDEALDEMQVATASTGEGTGYGVGWRVIEDRWGYRLLGHNGSMGGVNTHLGLVPSEGLVVVALANARCELPFMVGEEVLAALLPRYAEGLESEKRKAEEPGKPASAFEAPPELLGEWRGQVSTYEGDRPFTLRFLESGDIHAQLGDDLKTLVNDPRFENGFLTGQMMGDLRTSDASRYPHRIRLDLKPRGEVLNGAVIALTYLEREQGGAPGRRAGNALSYWAELRKVS